MSNDDIVWVAIERAERDRLFETGFSPPVYSAEFARSDYLREWEDACRIMRRNLDTEWKYGVGEHDYFMSDDPGSERCLCIEILDERMLVREAVGLVHEAIVNINREYRANICNGWVFLKDEHGRNYPEFNLIVDKGQIFVYSESDRVYQRLGMSKTRT